MASSSQPKKTYDVFLSFKGTDVHNNFLGHLYQALDQNGINTFIDEGVLRKGEQIVPMLMEAIEESCIAIIIFSMDYASSRWCLEELLKIMECKELKGLIVLPVFYKVDPREVRDGRESYKRALAQHELMFGKDSKTVNRWKKALFDAGCLPGLHFNDGNELELIQNIVKDVSTNLDQTPLHVAKHPVGIDSRVAMLYSMLNLNSNDDVVMIGLWGMGGIGKTTLSKALYNAISRQFEGSCLLVNVRETSKYSKDLVSLQETLLSTILSLRQRLKVSSLDRGINLIQERLGRKKVLIVLDDVDDLRQLYALAGESKWFGDGSRIIVTTRDKHLLTCHGIDHLYEVKPLEDSEARELLSNHAFRMHQNSEIRRELVDHVLYYARGLPLALEVLGSFLCDRREDEWESTLLKLFRIPNKDIIDVLKISYDELEDNEKEIFLHIDCFFKRKTSVYVKKVLDSCELHATRGLAILTERSLISIDEYGILEMHDLIQLMGMNIVKEECRDDPSRRSRLWMHDDVIDVLSYDTGDCAIKAIVLELFEPIEIYINPDAFTKMRRLRLLIMQNVHISSQGPIGFPNELRWFEWPELAPSLPKFCFGLKKLMGLDMDRCDITIKLKQFKTSVAAIEHVIDIDNQVKDVIKLLDIEDDEVGVRIIGIHGTNGIGKTTIAKAVYDLLSSCFDSCSFIAEIAETAENADGIQFVQTKLICDILEQDGDVASFDGGIEFFLDVFRNIKVLIVLDGVEDQSHLKALVGDQLDWFGHGSRIIVTSENGEILQEYVSRRVARIYEVNGMDTDRALELFCEHALGTYSSILDYLETASAKGITQVPLVIDLMRFLGTAEGIVKATEPVPFVIEVIGPFLRGKSIVEWWRIEDWIKPQENSQERLKDCGEILKKCYEELHEKQKRIFWDMGWFANGEDSRIASYMWPDRDFLPSHQVLMPLAKIGVDNMLWMHKLSKRLSRTIDKDETRRQYVHVTDVKLNNWKEGTEEVEALCFDLKNLHLHTFRETDFKSMPKIRFLKLDHASMTGNFTDVFPELRWLRWQGCPRDFNATTEFSLRELVILDLSWSKVTKDWEGWRLIKMKKLKVLNLTGCTDLLISPTFSCFPNLEILILERCSRLVHLHPSVGDLEKLLCLNLKSCTELTKLPAELGALKALKELLIDETFVRDISLGSDSKKVEHLKSLSILSADNSKITKLPNGVGVKLQRLSLRNCHWIQKLPKSIGQMGGPLEELDISGTGISKLPGSFDKFERLRVLKMDNCFIRKFPNFIWHLQNLEEIHASSCRNIEGEIPGDIGKLENLRILRLRNSAISKLPPEIKHLPKLVTLDVLHCNKLRALPALPSSLIIVHLSPKLKKKVSDLLMKKHCFITV